MKPLVEKLPLSGDTSFVARIHRTPLFEVPWHQHDEHELILFTEGEGLSFVGNYVGEFATGDVFFLGSNLPHTFQKSGDLITEAVVVHFRGDFWGTPFLDLPESAAIRALLAKAAHGFRLGKESKALLQPLIRSLTEATGFRRIVTLCECLAVLAETGDYTPLSTQETGQLNHRDKERLDRVFQYTMEHFREPVQLVQIAGIAGMSIPAFCNYFKKRTRKTYVDFVNEMRIGYACKLLLDAQVSVLQVCYDSGFNSVAHFNRQFLKIKGMPPSQYRKRSAGIKNALEGNKPLPYVAGNVRSLEGAG